MIKFSDFYGIDEIVEVNIQGKFSLDWSGKYQKTHCGVMQPDMGSGLTIGNLPLRANLPLPADFSSPDNTGWIYILRSCCYPILYVGISRRNLKTGVFGSGRFRHHVRKLLACRGAGTNHTGGWQEHARRRYYDAKRYQAAAIDEGRFLRSLWSDLRIAIAHVDNPQDHENFILCQYFDTHGNLYILNKRSSGKTSACVKYPNNEAVMCQQYGNLVAA